MNYKAVKRLSGLYGSKSLSLGHRHLGSSVDWTTRGRVCVVLLWARGRGEARRATDDNDAALLGIILIKFTGQLTILYNVTPAVTSVPKSSYTVYKVNSIKACERLELNIYPNTLPADLHSMWTATQSACPE